MCGVMVGVIAGVVLFSPGHGVDREDIYRYEHKATMIIYSSSYQCTYTYFDIYTHLYMCSSSCTPIYTYLYIYIYIYIYISNIDQSILETMTLDEVFCLGSILPFRLKSGILNFVVVYVPSECCEAATANCEATSPLTLALFSGWLF
jgi:hypothetical protein